MREPEPSDPRPGRHGPVTATQPYPVGLLLAGRRVVVVGGGHVSARRVPALLDAGADVVVVSPTSHELLRDLATDGRLRLEQRPYADGDLGDAWYAMAATDDPAANAAVAAEAERRRVFCVRADDAPAGTAWTPAVGHDGAVTVAVLAGRDPRRAALTRDALLDVLRAGPAPDHDG